MKYLLILTTLIVFGLTATISAQSETKVDTKVETKTYSIEGMTCQGCVSSVESKLGQIDGVQTYEVNLELGEVVVAFDTEKVKSEDIEKEFEGTSYKVTVKEIETETETDNQQE